MKYFLLFILLCPHSLLMSQEYIGDSCDIGREYIIPEVTVLSKRTINEIGIQQTKFDSTALKENIALSMADILAFNSSVFVKNYGRATLSTVAFRGTSPSHTQVTWYGMRINNPMLGMTDFSTTKF